MNTPKINLSLNCIQVVLLITILSGVCHRRVEHTLAEGVGSFVGHGVGSLFDRAREGDK